MKGKGVIVSVEGDRARVRVSSGSECMGCPSRSHCHGGGSGPREITAINDCGAKVSDTVIFEAEAGKMILSSALIWILPLVSMFVGYYVASRFAGGLWPIGAAFLFLALSYGVLRILDTLLTGGKSFYPRVSEILDSPDSCRERMER